MAKPNRDDVESKLLEFMNNNVRLIQYLAYAIGLVGLGVIARSSRIFTRFTSPSQVPKEFITKSVQLQAMVVGMESQRLHHNLRLKVEHIPVFSLPASRKRSNPLAVDLAGVLVTKEGERQAAKLLLDLKPIVWLKLYGISQDESSLHASIAFKRSWRQLWRRQDLAMILLKHGLATVAPFQPENNRHYPAYYRKLLQCEAKQVKP